MSDITPSIGQTWAPATPNSRVEPRTIIKVGEHQWSPGQVCVFFKAPSDDPSSPYPRVLSLQAWNAWVRKHKAQPQGEIPPLSEEELEWCRANPLRVRAMMRRP